MSNTIKTLTEIVGLCGQRQEHGDGAGEEAFEANFKLLEKVVETAGECLEDHVKAAARCQPRKERVYKEIIRRIAVHFCDVCDNPEQAFNTEEAVREILASYDIETTDYTGRKVVIS